MMNPERLYLQKDNIYAIPAIHYKMELAAQVRLAFDQIQPDCVAVELVETMQEQLIHAASRLPDISIVVAMTYDQEPLYYMCEPCDPTFEALRSALENNVPAFCIDLDVDEYPDLFDHIPDPYAIKRLGLKTYYELYIKALKQRQQPSNALDQQRELHMARRLKELSLRYSKVMFVGGMNHVENILNLLDRQSFPEFVHADRDVVELCTLTEDSCRNVLAEWGYLSAKYEEERSNLQLNITPDRQKIIFRLFKDAAEKYIERTGNTFPGYCLRNVMKFVRNYALINSQLMPNLYQIINAAKGCVDHNYAYEVWELATTYPYRNNIDSLPELNLSIEDVWRHSKQLRFHLKQKGRKDNLFERRRKDRSNIRFKPPGPFTICSFPPEDLVIEQFGDFLKKKGTQLLTEEGSHTIPFSTSLEDGLDIRETIRHWYEKKLYVKVKGKPPGGVGSVCVIFNDDKPDEDHQQPYQEKYPWCTTWIGEHEQESDMALYATSITENIIGPGISRCEYGGFMMSYPPRRLANVWYDPDYRECRSKSEVLLMAAIDYAVKPIVVYVASKPPRSQLKSFAQRYGKKIVYIPIGQLSPVMLNKLRVFHVLDGHDKREIADEYIF
jgi:hypothetical protein